MIFPLNDTRDSRAHCESADKSRTKRPGQRRANGEGESSIIYFSRGLIARGSGSLRFVNNGSRRGTFGTYRVRFDRLTGRLRKSRLGCRAIPRVSGQNNAFSVQHGRDALSAEITAFILRKFVSFLPVRWKIHDNLDMKTAEPHNTGDIFFRARRAYNWTSGRAGLEKITYSRRCRFRPDTTETATLISQRNVIL